MSHLSDPHFLVLHSLRLKGFAAEMAIARISGLAPSDVDAHLAALHADGLTRHREGRIAGWGLTPAGREHHAKQVADDLDAAGCRPVLETAFRCFLELNHPFLAVCTDWQVREGPGGEQIINDHKDAPYDRAVVARLAAIDGDVQPVCAELAAVMDRMGAYGPRLSAAREKLEAGDPEWFTGALIESYHTVWFELHEDLLATLGLERGAEGAGVAR